MKTSTLAVNRDESRAAIIGAAEMFVLALAFGGFGLIGCSKKSDSSGNVSRPPQAQQDATLATTGTCQFLLTVWQQGDKSGAVSRFLETDWSARPLFTPGSTLGITGTQFRALPAADRDLKAKEMMPQLVYLKQLAWAVEQAGIDAAAKKDFAQARKYFTSLKQCGDALDGPDSLALLKLVGQAFKKRANTELAKIGQ